MRIDAQVQDVASGRLLGAYTVRGNDVFPLVDQLTGEIRESLHVEDAPATRSISEITSNNPEADRLYLEGVEPAAHREDPPIRSAWTSGCFLVPGQTS